MKPISSRLIGGRYELLGLIAAGGMGMVYRARHSVTRQRVALKLLDPKLAGDETSLERFLREARVGALVDHEGIVKIFDAGVDHDPELGKRPFVAMEELVGRDLAGYLGRGRTFAAEAVDLVVRVLDPLAAAHAQGIVHRDLKPENIFIELDAQQHVSRVRLLDFGVARIPDSDLSLTADGTTLGTVYYMPNEQCLDARSVTSATDVYALGVILYQILGGVFPFDGDSAHAILIRAGSIEAMPLGSHAAGIDARLDDLVQRCLRKNPAMRPRDAAALRQELSEICADPAVRAWLEARRVDPSTFADDPPSDPFSGRPPAPSQHPETAPTLPDTPTAAMEPPPVSAPVVTSPRRPPWLALIASVGMALLLGMVLLFGRRPAVPEAAPQTPSERASRGAPIATPPPEAPRDPPPTAPTPPQAVPMPTQADTMPLQAVPMPAQTDPMRSTVAAQRGQRRLRSVPMPEPAQDPPPAAPGVVAAPTAPPAPVVAAPPVATPPPALRVPAIVAPAPLPPRPTATPTESPNFVTF